MATIKDVAAHAGVSATTVSIVLNGKAAERKISQKTQNKVWQAVKELGYHPNISARKLRSDEGNKPAVVIYWSHDLEPFLMGRFMRGLQEGSLAHYNYDFVIRPYTKDTLYLERGLQNTNIFHGAIIINASIKDLEYLANGNPRIPIVLFNRDLDGYSSVNIDNQAGRKAAHYFASAGYREAALIVADSSHYAMELRKQAFLEACAEHGIAISPEHIITAPHTTRGGAKAAEKLFHTLPPRALYCDSDHLALGVIHTCHQKGIVIPDAMEIVAMALTGAENTEYLTVPLSVIDFPIEAMAASSLEIIAEILKQNIKAPVKKYFETPLLVRK